MEGGGGEDSWFSIECQGLTDEVTSDWHLPEVRGGESILHRGRNKTKPSGRACWLPCERPLSLNRESPRQDGPRVWWGCRVPRPACGCRLLPREGWEAVEVQPEKHLTDISIGSLGLLCGELAAVTTWSQTEGLLVRDGCNNKGRRCVGPGAKGRQSSWRQIGYDVDKFIYIV